MYRKEDRQLGSCPKCNCSDSKIISYNAEWTTFGCWNCGIVYAQGRAFPHHYFRVQKKRSRSARDKALIGIGITVILVTSGFLAITLSDMLVNFGFNSLLIPSPSPYIINHSSSSFNLATPIPQNLLVNPQTMIYNYTLRGVPSQITFTVYGGLYNYLVWFLIKKMFIHF